MPAGEAHSSGLAAAVVPGDDLLEAALGPARRIRAAAPLAVAAVMEVLERTATTDIPAGFPPTRRCSGRPTRKRAPGRSRSGALRAGRVADPTAALTWPARHGLLAAGSGHRAVARGLLTWRGGATDWACPT
jgi:hypothetical protein